MSDAMVNLVREAYEPVVLDMLKRTPVLPPLTDEQRARLEQARRDEDDRIVALMRAHGNEPGTTSVCLCGHVAYSTPGYLLHLYTVAASDFTNRWGME